MLRLTGLEVFSKGTPVEGEVINGSVELTQAKTMVSIKCAAGVSFDLIGFYLEYDQDVNWDVNPEDNKQVDWEKGDLWSGEAVNVVVNHFPSRKRMYIAVERQNKDAIYLGTATVVKLFCQITKEMKKVKVWIETTPLS